MNAAIMQANFERTYRSNGIPQNHLQPMTYFTNGIPQLICHNLLNLQNEYTNAPAKK
jgi:hypothetical protein